MRKLENVILIKPEMACKFLQRISRIFFPFTCSWKDFKFYLDKIKLYIKSFTICIIEEFQIGM